MLFAFEFFDGRITPHRCTHKFAIPGRISFYLVSFSNLTKNCIVKKGSALERRWLSPKLVRRLRTDYFILRVLTIEEDNPAEISSRRPSFSCLLTALFINTVQARTVVRRAVLHISPLARNCLFPFQLHGQVWINESAARREHAV